jgi:hypothetical protein
LMGIVSDAFCPQRESRINECRTKAIPLPA